MKRFAQHPAFRIEADDRLLALALRKRIRRFTRPADSSAAPKPSRRGRSTSGAVLVSGDTPPAELIGLIRDAMQETGVEETTLWTGSSGLDINVSMDDATIGRAALLLTSLVATLPSSGELPGVPFS